MSTSVVPQVIHATRTRHGYVKQVVPATSSMRWLTQGVLHVEPEGAPVVFDEAGQETVFVCFDGTGIIEVDGKQFVCEKHDAFYLPRGMQAHVHGAATVTFCVCSAPVEGQYPMKHIPYAQLQADAKLRFVAGMPGAQREINLLVAQNVSAGRLIVGATRSLPGNWTSWPPHEHAATLEEIYFYYDMPTPAFGLQMLYDDAVETPNVAVVREGDAALLPRGYHPNVAIPGHPLNFIWIMAAHREVVDRQWGVVNNDPVFAAA